MVSDEKENTDWKVYLTILALLGGAVIVLVVRFFVTDFFNEDDMVKLIGYFVPLYESTKVLFVLKLLYSQNSSTFTPLKQQINSNFK